MCIRDRSISTDILEAAVVDGATGLKKIFYIVLPNLSLANYASLGKEEFARSALQAGESSATSDFRIG